MSKSPLPLRVTKAPNKTPYMAVGRLLRDAHAIYSRFFTLELAQLGVSFGEFQHLQYLWDADGITQVELAARIGITPATSTANLLSLEQKKLIRRVRNDEDRRKVNVFLTKSGFATKDKLVKCVSDTNARARRGMDEKQVRALFETLALLMENFESDND